MMRNRGRGKDRFSSGYLHRFDEPPRRSLLGSRPAENRRLEDRGFVPPEDDLLNQIARHQEQMLMEQKARGGNNRMGLLPKPKDIIGLGDAIHPFNRGLNLDRSGSSQSTPMALLNMGLNSLKRSLSRDPDTFLQSKRRFLDDLPGGNRPGRSGFHTNSQAGHQQDFGFPTNDSMNRNRGFGTRGFNNHPPNNVRMKAQEHLRNLEQKFDNRNEIHRSRFPPKQPLRGRQAFTSSSSKFLGHKRQVAQQPRRLMEAKKTTVTKRQVPEPKTKTQMSDMKKKLPTTQTIFKSPQLITQSVKSTPGKSPGTSANTSKPHIKTPVTTMGSAVVRSSPKVSVEVSPIQKRFATTPNEITDIFDEADSFPPYDPNVPVGQNLVIEVSGYFCKLCHKFYNNQTTAMMSHCQSQAHYDKVKKYLENKREKQLSLALAVEFSEDAPAAK